MRCARGLRCLPQGLRRSSLASSANFADEGPLCRCRRARCASAPIDRSFGWAPPGSAGAVELTSWQRRARHAVACASLSGGMPAARRCAFPAPHGLSASARAVTASRPLQGAPVTARATSATPASAHRSQPVIRAGAESRARSWRPSSRCVPRARRGRSHAVPTAARCVRRRRSGPRGRCASPATGPRARGWEHVPDVEPSVASSRRRELLPGSAAIAPGFLSS